MSFMFLFFHLSLFYVILIPSLLISHVLLVEGDCNSLLKVRGGASSEIVLGKDRVLLQFNVDLKSLVHQITDIKRWTAALSSVPNYFASFQLTSKSRFFLFKKTLLEILSSIKMLNPDCKLTAFVGSVEDALDYACTKNISIVLYVEDDSYRPSLLCLSYRRCLSDPTLAHLLNDEFLFYASSINQKLIKKFCSKLGILDNNGCPLLAVIGPSHLIGSKNSSKKKASNHYRAEVLAKLRLTQKELTSSKIVRFLHRFKGTPLLPTTLESTVQSPRYSNV